MNKNTRELAFQKFDFQTVACALHMCFVLRKRSKNKERALHMCFVLRKRSKNKERF